MDGLIIDSEPLWAQAEKQVFGKLGLRLGEEQLAQTVGMGLEEVVRFYAQNHDFQGMSQQQVVDAIHQLVLDLIKEKVQILAGARETLDFVRSKSVKIGLATASDPALIQAALGKLELIDYFDHLQSASELSYGKPHPEVYLQCAKNLEVIPDRCVGLEDSLPGLIAIKAAKMQAIVVPGESLSSDPRLALADVVLGSLLDLNEQIWIRLGL